jgi:hypothetical protein
MELSQNQMILTYLKTGKVITPIEALELCGCFRLSARIFELRADGWPIFCDRRATNTGKVVGHYKLLQDKSWWPVKDEADAAHHCHAATPASADGEKHQR